MNIMRYVTVVIMSSVAIMPCYAAMKSSFVFGDIQNYMDARKRLQEYQEQQHKRIQNGLDLIKSIKSGCWSAIKRAIERGADLNLRDEDGCAALHYAVASNISFMDDSVVKAVIKFLVDKGADINIQTTQGGKTPLHIAVAKESVSLVAWLLCLGANSLIKDVDKKAPLYYAQSRLEKLQLSSESTDQAICNANTIVKMLQDYEVSCKKRFGVSQTDDTK